MVSIKIKNDGIKNNILLIDEPEIGLHPSSCSLFATRINKNIGRNNIVVISTHSTFMIDKEEVERHII